MTHSASDFDRTLLARTRSALDQWGRTGGVGPTSSLTGGGAIEAFETSFAAMCGAAHALGLPSGTLALRTALQAVGISAGDRVVIPGLDWPAAAAAVLSLAALPVPADVSPASFLVDPDSVRSCLDPSTRAVVVTHVAGVPAQVADVHEICAQAGIPLVEDCCQALGAVADGRPVGTIGDVGVFSLGPGKLIDAGEGGVLVTSDDSIYRAAVMATQHPVRQLRTGLRPSLLSLSARLHPLAAIVALAELGDLPNELTGRRARAERILDVVSTVPGVVIPVESGGTRFSWPCVPALVTEEAKRELVALGFGAEDLGAYEIGTLLDTRARLLNARVARVEAKFLYASPRSRAAVHEAVAA